MKDYKERISKLMRKIYIRVNMRMDEETSLSKEQMNSMFPAYSRALKRVAQIRSSIEEASENPKIVSDLDRRNFKRASAVTMSRSGCKLFRAGGGWRVTKARLTPSQRA